MEDVEPTPREHAPAAQIIAREEERWRSMAEGTQKQNSRRTIRRGGQDDQIL